MRFFMAFGFELKQEEKKLQNVAVGGSFFCEKAEREKQNRLMGGHS
jgi:hypothetical protein